MKKYLLFFAISAFSITIAFAGRLNGIPIASSKVEDAIKAFDEDETTFFLSNQGSYSWVGLDLGERYVIDKVSWVPNPNVKVTELGLFQGANSSDFSDAIPIYIIDDTTLREGDVKCSRGFRYVRYVGPANSYCQIAEVSFYGIPGDGDDSNLMQLTNLPTVCINTVNGEIPYDKETYILSTFILISDDGKTLLEKSETGIRERGNASREFPKKPWKIKFDKKQNILDAPAKAKKWTLLNNYGDKTLMRNMLAFDVARMMGMEYVPYCSPVDVILNGEYKGCYQLCDQVEVNDDRLEIEEMKADDIEGEALTGGYFVEIDGYAYEEPVWFQTDHYYLPVTVKSPDEDVIVDKQLNYIKDYFNNLENLMKDKDPVTGYRSVFDNESFIQHMLVNEVAGNTDTYWSTFMYKRRSDPVIYTGPVWDFDLGFNNDFRTYPVTQRSGDGYLWNTDLASAAGNMKYFAQRILIKDESTASEILQVWQKARKNGLTAEWLESKVEEYADLLNASQRLNFMRWPILNQKVHMNPNTYGSYENECKMVKSYIRPQINHLDKVIGFDPTTLEEDNKDAEEDPGDENSVIYVDSEDSEIIYFTLDGLQISKPSAAGLYIEKRGDTVRKILSIPR